MDVKELLKEIKARLQEAHGRRLKGVVLYGSTARGDAGPDSDIDVLVLLEDPIDFGRDLEANIDALYPLSVRLEKRISAKPVSVREYRTENCPLFEHAKRDGIAA